MKTIGSLGSLFGSVGMLSGGTVKRLSLFWLSAIFEDLYRFSPVIVLRVDATQKACSVNMCAKKTKVFIHAGFHKTGTTTLQRGLNRNAAYLSEALTLILPGDATELIQSARRFSIKNNAENIRRFQEVFRSTVVTRLQRAPGTLLLSCEDLSGIIPGRKNIWSYRYAPDLAILMIEELRMAFPTDLDIKLIYTTRSFQPWVKSVFWQNLRGRRMSSDLEEYIRNFENHPTLLDILQKIKEAVPPDIEVAEIRVERSGDPHALFNEFLGEIGIDPEGLSIIENQNKTPPDGIQYFLDLNRSNLSDEAVKEKKSAFLRKWRKSGARLPSK